MPYLNDIPDQDTKGRNLHWRNRKPIIEITSPSDEDFWATLHLKHDRVVFENSRGQRGPLTYNEAWILIKRYRESNCKVRGYAINLPKEDRA